MREQTHRAKQIDVAGARLTLERALASLPLSIPEDVDSPEHERAMKKLQQASADLVDAQALLERGGAARVDLWPQLAEYVAASEEVDPATEGKEALVAVGTLRRQFMGLLVGARHALRHLIRLDPTDPVVAMFTPLRDALAGATEAYSLSEVRYAVQEAAKESTTMNARDEERIVGQLRKLGRIPGQD